MEITQGDQYAVPLALRNNGKELPMDIISEVEFTIKPLSRTYPGRVKYRDGWFYFPLTQKETLRFRPGWHEYQAKVHFIDDSIVIAQGGKINVLESLSKGEI